MRPPGSWATRACPLQRNRCLASYLTIMRILALNIQHGAGKRLPGVLAYAEEVDADVIVLTEYRHNTNAQPLQDGLELLGHSLVSCSVTAPRQNGVAIFARVPGRPLFVEPLPHGHEHRIAGPLLGDLAVLGCYFPQKQAKAELFGYLSQLAPSIIDAPAIIAGDLNTGIHGLDEDGATFYCEPGFRGLLDSGFSDAWRARHPAAREYSWYSSAGNGFRVDHILASRSADARIRSIEYDHRPRDARVTDHSALVAELVR